MKEPNADKANDILRKEKISAVRRLILGIVGLQDSLTVDVETNKDFEDAETQAIRYANDSLDFFIKSKPKFSSIQPRSIREPDRRKILPGQHAGVFIQLTVDDGTVLRVNFYGGLRTTVANDLRDRDPRGTHSHTQRTDEVISQLVHLNWQIIFADNQTIDSWIVFNPDNNGTFRQHNLQFNKETVDVHPLITATDSRFNQLKKNIFEPIEQLVKLIPTSV